MQEQQMNKFGSNTSIIRVLIPIKKKSRRPAIGIVETCNRHEFGSNPGPCCLVLVGSRNGPLTYVSITTNIFHQHCIHIYKRKDIPVCQ